MIACLLLAYLLIANWTRISMYCHKKWIKMKIKKNEREIQAEAVRQDEEEKRIQAEVQGRLEAQRGAPNQEQAPAIRVDIS